ncbi:organomercurial lyase [Natrinema sp. DC36]|uniref:organomercurial lyase n=1 Tax=Natrinema sp. DC36 TaxID=2878680 RepID=UPI001CF0C43A|nr:organomercurial lyase [Natrinema sp. DC36]
MTEQTCECCEPLERQSAVSESESDRESATTAVEDGPSVDRWLGETAVMETPLPEDVQTAMERFFGDVSITTLAEWVTELRDRIGGGSIEIDDLCHADEETGHWGELDGTRYDFQCFYDAVALAELSSKSVEVRTESPDGTVIEARATGDGDVTATPTTAVVSFGVATDGSAAMNGGPTLEDAYTSICPVVTAFPTRSAYEQWAAQTPVATVGLPISAATGVATGLVDE